MQGEGEGKRKERRREGLGERDREKKKKADCREEEQQGVGRNERERTNREGWMRTEAGGDRGRRAEGGLGSSGALVVFPLRFGEPWGPTSQGGGGADLSRLPASLKAHCLPAALWLHLLTSACRNTGSCLQLAGCPQPACCPHPLAAHGSEVAAPAPACTGRQGRGELRAEQALQAGAVGHRRLLGGKVRPAQRNSRGLGPRSREGGAGLARSAKALRDAGLWTW